MNLMMIIIGDLRNLFSITLTNNDIQFRTDIEKVIRVLKKLIDNALKFTPQGTVEVGCRQIDETQIGFYVADTGIGIPSDKYDVVFELFRQADESTSRHRCMLLVD
jgi:signal transduction histidine kinase